MWFCRTLDRGITGGVGGGAAYLWQRQEPCAGELALVVWLGMMAICGVASVTGYVVPWILHKTGRDPAAAADPLIVTIKDVTALRIYFGLTAILLGDLLENECVDTDADEKTATEGGTTSSLAGVLVSGCAGEEVAVSSDRTHMRWVTWGVLQGSAVHTPPEVFGIEGAGRSAQSSDSTQRRWCEWRLGFT